MNAQDRVLACCVPAGRGVHTVHTARDKREGLERLLYGKNDVQTVWQNQIADIKNTQKPIILGLCSDAGGGICRGANWGPLFIRKDLYETVSSDAVLDIGDIKVIPHLLHDSLLNEKTLASCRQALYQNAHSELPVSPLSIAKTVADTIYEINPDAKLITLGGDHSCSYPVCKSYLQHKKSQNIRTAVIHFDAHTDLLDKRLGIEYNFATWAYHILGDLHTPKDLLQIGIRASGHDKAFWQKTLGIQQFWADEVKQQGAQVIAQQIIDYCKTENIQQVYISFDIDALDADYISATGTPEVNGLTPDDACTMLDLFNQHLKVTGCDLMEVAPFVNNPVSANPRPQPQTTLEVTTQLMRRFINQ